MKYEYELDENETIARKPDESGWYLCKVFKSSVAYWEESYKIAEYKLELLYWEENVWIVHPRSYKTVDEKDVLEWMRVPDDFNITEQTIKINLPYKRI